jgi:hypothetical protein
MVESMKSRDISVIRWRIAVASLVVLVPFAAATLDSKIVQHAMPSSACSVESRREALKTTQSEVLRSVPSKVPSLVGSAYFGTQTAVPKSPARPCVTAEERVVHEARRASEGRRH